MRERSYSRAVVREALHIASELGAPTQMLDLRALNLPMYVPDFALPDYPAEHQEAIARLIDACQTAKVLIWSSPCYHGTVSGIFKNAIDFLELLSEATPAYLNAKAVGIIAINDSKTFSAMSNSVHELQAWLAPTHVMLTKNDFNADMRLSTPSAIRRVTRLVNELLAFARKH